jgi:hypothetical protein
MSLEVVLAKQTRSSFNMSIYIGSTTVMITVLYVLKAVVASSQWCLAALICAAVPPPSIADGARPGKVGLTQAVNGEIPS